MLVPTTVLAFQHYQTFCERLKDFLARSIISAGPVRPLNQGYLERTERGRGEYLDRHHRIVGKDVRFKDLGLLIIDEEQKFGVSVKEKLRQLKVNVDTLTMTATPIPVPHSSP